VQHPDGDDIPDFYGLEQAQKDAAYNNSEAVTDSAGRLQDWGERSAVLRAKPSARIDIPYGDRPNNCIDYFPSGHGGGPLFVFIHGGYWYRNSKETFSFVAAGPCAHGINVATIGYTLAPQASLTEIIGEVFRALGKIKELSDELGFERERIYVGGWSAGGHLATLSASLPMVRGVMSISGIFDLEPIAQTYINDVLKLQPAEIETLAPIRNLPERTMPIALFVGADELPELRRQSRAYAQYARTGKLLVTMTVLPGCNHYTIMEELASPDGILTRALIDIVAGSGSRI
jgi:arylformamidase